MKKASSSNRALLLKLEMPSHPRLLCVVRGAIEPLMETLGFSESDCRAITRAVDEALSNIMRHSYQGRMDRFIDVSCRRVERRGHSENGQGVGVEILMFDCGPPIDPAKLHGRPLDEIRPGGLGLHLIRDTMDRVEYTRTGRLNRLRMVKYTRPSKRRPNP